MLAYVFWHRPRPEIEASEYEDAQRGFHDRLGTESACFRLAALPFDPGPGYEDWYLVGDWAALGDLNVEAIDRPRRAAHDRAAGGMGAGWGAVYALLDGPEEIPAGVEWVEKPRGLGTDEFVARYPGRSVWRRQMVLGPGASHCVDAEPSESREPVWP
jgi:hypothetical protein